MFLSGLLVRDRSKNCAIGVWQARVNVFDHQRLSFVLISIVAKDQKWAFGLIWINLHQAELDVMFNV